ncbi:MAG: enoyl-CoA hydratase [Actinobacteria bacterium]|nr:enoyl-CoA hydratase [Actinomycetota bacterium]MBI3256778.1 enoyl-CoA hydratase [Actinomycetota bacterium]
MTEDVLLIEVADSVATITLNRPQARNALSGELLGALPKAITDCESRDDVTVMILTGTDPAFCAGLDLKELGSGGGGSLMPGPRQGPLPARLKPLIGAVNGPAITGGFELALACDFLIASDRARFADTHARVGVQPLWGLTVLLPQAIGVRRAREMSATGNFIDAETAHAWGLVNHVVAHDDLLGFCRSLAADIVGNNAAGVQRIMATYAEGSMLGPGEAWDLETKAGLEWMMSGGRNLADDVEQRRRAVTERGRAQSTDL